MCFFQGRGDRENRLLIIIPQVYLLSCLCDSVSLHSPPLPFMSVLWLGPCSWAVCLLPSLPGRKKEKKKKLYSWWLLIIFTVFPLSFIPWPLFPCLFVTVLSWHLSFMQSAGLLPVAGLLPASCRPCPFQSAWHASQKCYNKCIYKYS